MAARGVKISECSLENANREEIQQEKLCLDHEGCRDGWQKGGQGGGDLVGRADGVASKVMLAMDRSTSADCLSPSAASCQKLCGLEGGGPGGKACMQTAGRARRPHLPPYSLP